LQSLEKKCTAKKKNSFFKISLLKQEAWTFLIPNARAYSAFACH